MSKDINGNEEIAEMQWLLENHPDHELFLRLGSPKNFQTRQYLTGEEVIAGDVSHYTYSQSVFANHSMKCLINLIRKFNYKEGGFSMEDLYEAIADERLLIFLNTPGNYREEILLKASYHKLFGDEKYREVFSQDYSEKALRDLVPEVMEQEMENKLYYLKALKYRPSIEVTPSITHLGISKKYERYCQITESQNPIKLFDFMSVIGEESTFLDYDSFLGALIIDNESVVTHLMGSHRTHYDTYVGTTFQKTQEQLQEEVIKRSRRVDEITDLSAKKALEIVDEDQAMKCAFAFVTLRGYNLRSQIGACFAQEMSLRWLFAQKDWPQFNKSPGIYLDVEASLNNNQPSYSFIPDLINKEISDYRQANLRAKNKTINLGDDPIFDVPHVQNQEDFITYLMEARRYRAEDLFELVSCPNSQKVFNIAARNGDVVFFEMLQRERENNPVFKDLFEDNLPGFDRGAIIENAMEYGGGEIMSKVSNIFRPVTVFASKSAQKISPVSVSDRESPTKTP